MAVQFNRTPYKVTYYQDGEKITINRRPPPKVHDLMPTDIVRLSRKKSDDFQEGDVVTVKSIQNRSPNTLQISNEEGLTSFVDYYDASLESKEYLPPGVSPLDLPKNNEYLLWP